MGMGERKEFIGEIAELLLLEDVEGICLRRKDSYDKWCANCEISSKAKSKIVGQEYVLCVFP